MTSRRNRIAEAERRAKRTLSTILDDVHERRISSGVHQSDVAAALGWSRSWYGALERGEVAGVGLVELSRMAAAVGLDVSARTFEAVSVLRDAGQVKLLNRLRSECHPDLPWRLEPAVAVGDPRAFDALIGRPPQEAAIEAITRLRDGQAQVRRAQAKQEAAGIGVLILLLNATEANRRAFREAGAQLRDAFPLTSRTILAALRQGDVPSTNGIVLL